jgi:transmembrane sensor
MDSHADDEALIAAVRHAIASQLPEAPETERMRQAFWAQREQDAAALSAREMPRGRPTPWAGRRSAWSTRARLVLGGAVVAAAAALWYWRAEPGATRGTSRVTGRYATGAGQRATVQLADGSVVTLAPMSRLIMRGTTAELTGEAFFTVAHAVGTPFAVRTGAVTTRVLGTAFAVRHYANDHETVVAVTEGKVSVGGSRVATLVGGTVGHATDSTVVFTHESGDQYTAWTSGHLVFRDTPLSELLETVGRWYGVQFRIADTTLARQRITSTIDFGSRTELLHALSLVLDVTATYENGNDHVIVIQARRAKASLTPSRGEMLVPATLEVGR